MSATILSIIIFSLPFYLFRYSVFGVPTNITEVVIIIGFIVWLISRWQKSKSSTRDYACSDNKYSMNSSTIAQDKLGPNSKINWRLPWVVWAWLAVGIIAALINPDWLSGLGYWKAYFLVGVLSYIIIINEYNVAKNIIPRALILVGALVALVSMTSFWGWNIAADGRWLGWFGLELSASPNFLSLFLTPLIAISLVGVLSYRGLWRYVSIIASIFMAVALWGTQSRGAAIGICGGLVLATLWYFMRKIKTWYTWLWVVFMMFVLIAVLTFGFAQPDLNATPDAGRVATSNNIRWYIWQTSTEIVSKNPILGVGLGNYQNYFTELTQNRVNFAEYISPLALTAHNLYLHILASMGIVGLAIFIWWIGELLVQLSITDRKKELAPIVAAFGSILCYGLVDTPIFKNDLAIIWWIIAALIYIYHVQEKRNN